MTRSSVAVSNKVVSSVPRALAVSGALAVLTLMVNAAHAANPPVTPAAAAQTDQVTAGQVYDALNADPIDYFRHVDVQVRQGVVTLSGYVWDTPSLYRAEEIAARIPGVIRVKDQMELERAGVAPHA